MTYSYVRHDLFLCETWLIHTWDMTHSYVWHDSVWLSKYHGHRAMLAVCMLGGTLCRKSSWTVDCRSLFVRIQVSLCENIRLFLVDYRATCMLGGTLCHMSSRWAYSICRLLKNTVSFTGLFCKRVWGCENGIGGFHENLVTFKRPKLPDFEWAEKMRRPKMQSLGAIEKWQVWALLYKT